MNIRKLLSIVEAPYLKSGVPSFRTGETVKVHVKVVEGESERIQPFEGIIIAKHGSALSETFTVRKTSFGIGIERTFPVHSPRIVKIEIIKSGKVRRAKLYYLRALSGKSARIEEIDTPLSHSSAQQASSKNQEPQNNNPEPALSH